MAQKRKFYVVWRGREPGLYDNWEDARQQVENFKGASYKSFTSQRDATAAFRNGIDQKADAAALGKFLINASATAQAQSGEEEERKGIEEKKEEEKTRRFPPEVDMGAIAVDASCLGKPGKMESRGVDLATGEEIFRVGVFEDATNNIGEYLALVHALALCQAKGWRRRIYSDSRTAIGWVFKRHANTAVRRTPRNGACLDLVARADKWLQTHPIGNRIEKWKTEEWGEIPADFDRK